ncbi:hypothetical protein PSHT_15091 [Puccinia striiformis]|uniref:Uncharacterized protein n=1 Tax=Puccinia striiformis TaxID=27350 RepID=A0A2S4UH13_9BASI|nr:hypothetical protein PSHT_15091 [Puccinia striiformis]
MVPTLWLIIVLSQASGYILGAPSPGLASTSLASVQKEVPASCQQGSNLKIPLRQHLHVAPSSTKMNQPRGFIHQFPIRLNKETNN